MSNKISFGIGGIIVGLVLASIFATTKFPGFRNGNVGMMGNIDKHFIEQMIPHHEGAIAMANLALQKAKRPEIKTLATAIIAAQTTEIQSMNDWYQDWFGNTVPKVSPRTMGSGMMSQNGMHMGGQEDVTALESALDFDKAFIEEMIPHHQLAIMMAQMLRSGTSRPEMLTLANNIVTSQSEEIQEMQSWYKEWFR